MSIAVIIFLFAFSPTIFSTASSTNGTPAAVASQAKPSLLPLGQTIPALVQRLPTKIYDASVNCAVAPYCVATADEGGADVAISQGTILVATVAVCGIGFFGLTYVSSMKAWVYADYGCGQLETISAKSPYTVKNLTSANSVPAGYGIAFDAKNKLLYVAQYGPGEVAAVTTKGVVTEIDLLSAPGCSQGYDAVNVAVSASTGIVYVAVQGGSCAAAINGTKVIYTTSSIATEVGVVVNQANHHPYFSTSYETVECTTNLYSCTEIIGYGDWGNFYAPYDKSVWIESCWAYEGYMCPISKKNVEGSFVYTGYANDGGCSSGKTLTATDWDGGSEILYNIKTNQTSVVTLSIADPLGCAYST